MTLQAEDQVVWLVVQDGSTSLPVRATANNLDIGGRGLPIVDLLSRDWGITPRTRRNQVSVGVLRHTYARSDDPMRLDSPE